MREDGGAHKDDADRSDEPHRLIVPFGGLNQVWGVLMATKSDDPAVQRQIVRQRRLVASLMILTAAVSVIVGLLLYVR